MIDEALQEAKQRGITNILALRGDPPRGEEEWTPIDPRFKNGTDLVKYIQSNPDYASHFCVGVIYLVLSFGSCQSFFYLSAPHTMSAADGLDAALSRLETAVNSLPDSLHIGRRDSPLVAHLTPPGTSERNTDADGFPTHDEGAYFAFNKPWERAFQNQAKPAVRNQLVSCGKYGTGIAFHGNIMMDRSMPFL
uniref:MTHFR-domain-containing protein n=1 Tax=Mycena chlorophos TaxID=658473 RepID=A0ABQ0LBA1_MYCCL|nr:MTHFR-domain-containing protein [Mycena chlorophos]